jgi:hypothetical protein
LESCELEFANRCFEELTSKDETFNLLDAKNKDTIISQIKEIPEEFNSSLTRYSFFILFFFHPYAMVKSRARARVYIYKNRIGTHWGKRSGEGVE